MSDQVNPLRDGESEMSESGLLKSVEPLYGGASMHAAATDDDASDSSGISGGDSDTTDMGDADGSDTLGGDSDGSDAFGDSDASDSDASDALGGDDSDASDADNTDMGGDETESESGLGGENPLGLGRTRAIKNGDDKDTRDT